MGAERLPDQQAVRDGAGEGPGDRGARRPLLRPGPQAVHPLRREAAAPAGDARLLLPVGAALAGRPGAHLLGAIRRGSPGRRGRVGGGLRPAPSRPGSAGEADRPDGHRDLRRRPRPDVAALLLPADLQPGKQVRRPGARDVIAEEGAREAGDQDGDVGRARRRPGFLRRGRPGADRRALLPPVGRGLPECGRRAGRAAREFVRPSPVGKGEAGGARGGHPGGRDPRLHRGADAVAPGRGAGRRPRRRSPTRRSRSPRWDTTRRRWETRWTGSAS